MVLCLLDSRLNWNLEMPVFEEREKPNYQEKNLSEQKTEPTANSTHIWRPRQDFNRATMVGGECSHHCATNAPLGFALWTEEKRSRSTTLRPMSTQIKCSTI